MAIHLKTKSSIFIIFTLLFLSSGCAYYNALYNANKNYKKGIQAKQQINATAASGRLEFEKVIDGCAGLLELYPKSKWVPDALLLMGKAYFETGQLSKAERKFLELINNYPNHTLYDNARVELGRTLIVLKRKDEGRAILNTLLTNTQEQIRTEASIILANDLIADSLYSLALNRLSILSNQVKDNRQKYRVDLEKVFCYEQLNLYTQAIELINDILRNSSLNRNQEYDFRYRRAILNIRQNNPSAARIDLIKLLKDNNYKLFFDKTRLLLATAHISEGNEQKGKTVWSELMVDEKNRTEFTSAAAFERALYHRQKNETDSIIINDLERAKRDRPGSVTSIQADSLLQIVRQESKLNKTYDSAIDNKLIMEKLLVGEQVVDSIFRKYKKVRLITDRINETSIPVESGKDEIDSNTVQNSSDSIATDNRKQDESIQDTSYTIIFLDTLKLKRDINLKDDEIAQAIIDWKDYLLSLKDTSKAVAKFNELFKYARGRVLRINQYEFALIMQKSGNDKVADSLFSIIAEDSSEVDLSNHVRKELGQEKIPVEIDRIEVRYKLAESMLIDNQDTVNALKLFQEIVKQDTSVWYRRAIYAVALLSQDKLKVDSLMNLFQKSLSYHRDTPSSRYIQKRLEWLRVDDRVDSTHVDSSSVETIPDSILTNEKSRIETENEQIQKSIQDDFQLPSFPTNVDSVFQKPQELKTEDE